MDTYTYFPADMAVSRVYRTHFELGLMDPEEHQSYNYLGPGHVDTAESRALALRAVFDLPVLIL